MTAKRRGRHRKKDKQPSRYMKSATLLAALPLSLLALTATAQTEVAAYQPGVTADGITYFLPRTCLRVAVTARHTRHEPGEFCAYAERYLRLKDVPQTAYDTWTIEKVELVPYGEADKTEAYSIKFKTKTSAPLVGLAKDGRLLSVNTNATEEKALPTESVTPDAAKTLNASDYKTAEILAAGSVAKMAELTANEIYDIRENRGCSLLCAPRALTAWAHSLTARRRALTRSKTTRTTCPRE